MAKNEASDAKEVSEYKIYSHEEFVYHKTMECS